MSSMLLAGEEFQNYGPSHLAALVVFGAGAVAVVAIGRRHRGSGAARRFSRSWALAIPVFAVPLQILQFLPSDWDFDTSLPLQLCDLAWMAAVWALWTHRPWAIGLTYFWSLTLTTQAIVTPALAQDFPTPRYFMYWGMHFVIVWAAIYLVWGLRLTPTWRVYRTAVAVTAGWAVCIFTFNSIVGSNYGFLNRKPTTPSILDLLGPWPLYVVTEIALVATMWALMTWPWVAIHHRRGHGESSARITRPSSS